MPGEPDSKYPVAQHFGDRVELRPSDWLTHNKAQHVGCVLVFMLLLIGFYGWRNDRQLREIGIWSVVLIPIWLIVVFVQLSPAPTSHGSADHRPRSYILHGETLLSVRSEFSSVQLAA